MKTTKILAVNTQEEAKDLEALLQNHRSYTKVDILSTELVIWSNRISGRPEETVASEDGTVWLVIGYK